MRVTVGAASGLGNTLFLLPLLHRLHEARHDVALYVDADYPLASLWRRCRYVRTVVENGPVPTAERYLAGPWLPMRMRRLTPLTHQRWVYEPHYPYPEWQLNLEAGLDAGLIADDTLPDVSDWCVGLDRTPRWDVGLVQGCKPGALWARKRVDLAALAKQSLEEGRTVVAFGLPEDWPDGVPAGVENHIGRYDVGRLPDALAGCRAVIGTDSGPTHLAASLGVPTVVLFTATSDIKGQPVGLRSVALTRGIRCQPCQMAPTWEQCRDWQCQQIPVEQVMQAVEEVRR